MDCGLCNLTGAVDIYYASTIKIEPLGAGGLNNYGLDFLSYLLSLFQ